jgi:hypothetical protein
LASMTNFDTQAQQLYPNVFNLTTRKFVVEIELESNQPTQLENLDSSVSITNASLFGSSAMHASNWSMQINLANYAVFSVDSNATTPTNFSYNIIPLNGSDNGSTVQALLQFEFHGNFTYATYDPDFSVILPGTLVLLVILVVEALLWRWCC